MKAEIGPERSPPLRPLEFRPRADCAWPKGWMVTPKWQETAQRLSHTYGHKAVLQIADGQDRRTNADLDAWRRLGVR